MMKFCNVPSIIDLRDEVTVISIALSNNYFLKTFCEFLKGLMDGPNNTGCKLHIRTLKY